jgi:hypothetical protein
MEPVSNNTSAQSVKPGLLEPDAGEIAKFVNALFRYASPGAYVSLRSFFQHEDKPFVITAAKVGAGSNLHLVTKEATNLARTCAQSTVASVFCPPVATFDNPRKAAEANVVDGLAISVELDENPTAALELLITVLGEPTVVVRSGGTWTDPWTGEVLDKLHGYWRLKTPARDDARIALKRAQVLACKIAGGDPSDQTAVHPLRWPGSWHRKGDPVLCRIASCNSGVEVELANALASLEKACPESSTKPGDNRSQGSQEGGEWETLIYLVLTSESYHEPLTRLAAKFLRAGMSDGAAVNMLRGLMMNATGPHDARWQQRYDYIPRAVSTAREKIPAELKKPETKPLPQWPDPKPLPSGLLAVKPFNVALLPGTIGPWVEDISDRMQCPPDFVGIPAMTALGSVLGNRIGIRPQRRTDWLEVPNFWACVVGRPGLLKSPAMAEATKPLRRMEADAREANAKDRKRYEAELALFKCKQDGAKAAAKKLAEKGLEPDLPELDEPEEPKARRYIVTDTSYEALGEILTANPNGVMVLRDELISLLQSLDREEYVAARGFFLTGWNGTTAYTFDRIIRGHTHVEAACISLLGSTQPAKIAQYTRRAVRGQNDDGLIQRFGMMVWPDHSGEWRNTDRYPDTTARQAAWATFTYFNELTPEKAGTQRDEFEPIPFLRFDEEAQQLFDEWREDLEKRLRSGQLHPALESHFAKYRKLVPALALVSSLADGLTGRVDAPALNRALAFAEYLESHAHRLYGASLEAEATAAKALLARIRNGELNDGFTCREVCRHHWSNLSDPEQVQAGLDLLVDYHWLAEDSIRTPGRPKVTYLINPKARR